MTKSNALTVLKIRKTECTDTTHMLGSTDDMQLISISTDLRKVPRPLFKARIFKIIPRVVDFIVPVAQSMVGCQLLVVPPADA